METISKYHCIGGKLQENVGAEGISVVLLVSKTDFLNEHIKA